MECYKNYYWKTSLSATYNCLVWFLAGGISGPYFFNNKAGVAVSVNGLRYRNMINQFLWPWLEDIDVDDVYSQQDGATYHTSGETVGLLHENFQGRVII